MGFAVKVTNGDESEGGKGSLGSWIVWSDVLET